MLLVIMIRVYTKKISSVNAIQPDIVGNDGEEEEAGEVEGGPVEAEDRALERKIRQIQNRFRQDEMENVYARGIRILASQLYCTQVSLFLIYCSIFLRNLDPNFRLALFIILGYASVSILHHGCDLTTDGYKFLSKIYQRDDRQEKCNCLKTWYRHYLNPSSGGTYAEAVLLSSEIFEILVQVINKMPLAV